MTKAFRPADFDRRPLALTALGLGAALYLWRRPSPAATEPHEVVLARWEDEGGNVLAEEARETAQEASSRLQALVAKGEALLTEIRGEDLLVEGTKVARRGLAEGRRIFRKHPVATTAAGVALGLALVTILSGRRSR